MSTTSAVETAKCRWCGMIHGSLCPQVKAIEFFADGTVKRVEFKTPADFAPLPLAAGRANPLAPSTPTWLQTTWGGCDACRLSGVCSCVRPGQGATWGGTA